jgi:hypothetical protein
MTAELPFNQTIMLAKGYQAFAANPRVMDDDFFDAISQRITCKELWVPDWIRDVKAGRIPRNSFQEYFCKHIVKKVNQSHVTNYINKYQYTAGHNIVEMAESLLAYIHPLKMLGDENMAQFGSMLAIQKLRDLMGENQYVMVFAGYEGKVDDLPAMVAFLLEKDATMGLELKPVAQTKEEKVHAISYGNRTGTAPRRPNDLRSLFKKEEEAEPTQAAGPNRRTFPFNQRRGPFIPRPAGQGLRKEEAAQQLLRYIQGDKRKCDYGPCGRPGHTSARCYTRMRDSNEPVPSELRCRGCQAKGEHYTLDCPKIQQSVRMIMHGEDPGEEEGYDDQTCDVTELLAKMEAYHAGEPEAPTGNGENPPQ